MTHWASPALDAPSAPLSRSCRGSVAALNLVSEPQQNRLLLTYLCFYHLGAAAWISEHEEADFWRWKLCAIQTHVDGIDVYESKAVPKSSCTHYPLRRVDVQSSCIIVAVASRLLTALARGPNFSRWGSLASIIIDVFLLRAGRCIIVLGHGLTVPRPA